MSKTIQEILGFENLTGIIQNPAGGVPTDMLPPSYMTMTKSVMGNTAKWTEIRSARNTMKRINYGDPSVRAAQQDMSTRTAVIQHNHEHQMHDVNVLNAIRQFDNPMVQKLGQQVIDSQSAEFRRKVDNTRMSMVFSMLANGSISWDNDGNLLPTTVGATVTANFNIGADNLNQGADESGATIITVSWANAAAKIMTDIKQFKDTARQRTGLPLVDAFYGLNMPDYLLTNSQTKELINRSPELRASLASGEIPNGFLGLNWFSVSGAFYEDSSGTNQLWFGADDLVLAPAVTTQWYLYFEGTYEVPSGLGMIGADASAMVSQFRTVQGRFSYAKITDDPPGIKHNAGDTSMPVLRNPDAIYILDVTP